MRKKTRAKITIAVPPMNTPYMLSISLLLFEKNRCRIEYDRE